MKKLLLFTVLSALLVSCNNNVDTQKGDSDLSTNQENTVSDSKEKEIKPCDNIWFKDIDELDFDSLCVNKAFDDSVCSAMNLLIMASEGDTNFVMKENLFFELLNINRKLDMNSFNDKQFYYCTLFNLEHVADGIMSESLGYDLFELFEHNPCEFYKALHPYAINYEFTASSIVFECQHLPDINSIFIGHEKLFTDKLLQKTVNDFHKEVTRTRNL